jgi:hypothetical protein
MFLHCNILKKLDDEEGKEKYRTEVSNRFAALEIIMSTKESIGYYEMKKHKQWVDEGCSKRKHDKFQWLQDPGQIKWDNLNNV